VLGSGRPVAQAVENVSAFPVINPQMCFKIRATGTNAYSVQERDCDNGNVGYGNEIPLA
jgi:hypothetical protein